MIRKGNLYSFIMFAQSFRPQSYSYRHIFYTYTAPKEKVTLLLKNRFPYRFNTVCFYCITLFKFRNVVIGSSMYRGYYFVDYFPNVYKIQEVEYVSDIKMSWWSLHLLKWYLSFGTKKQTDKMFVYLGFAHPWKLNLLGVWHC